MEKKEEKKDFVEPELVKYEEKFDEVTMGGQPVGSLGGGSGGTF